MPSPSSTPTPKAPLAVLWSLVHGVKHWAPVWIPGILLWQFATKGLQPALVEAQRLQGVTPGVIARHAEAQAAFEQVKAEAQAWQDPVYRERLRRLRFQEPVGPTEASTLEPRWQPDPAGNAPLEADPQEGNWLPEDDFSGELEFAHEPTEQYGPNPDGAQGEPWLASQGNWLAEPGPSGTFALDAESLRESTDAWTPDDPALALPALEPYPQSEPQDTPTASFLVD